jgi:hypothetical protein
MNRYLSFLFSLRFCAGSRSRLAGSGTANNTEDRTRIPAFLAVAACDRPPSDVW